MALERRRAPSLAELDSNSSFSSLEEAEEGPDRPPAPKVTPPAAPRPHGSGLRRMSAAFVTLFAPEKRVAQLVDELSQDRRSAFGALVQDFLQQQREELEAQAPGSAATLLQGLRHFLSQAKCFLLDCGELEPPLETLVPEKEKGTDVCPAQKYGAPYININYTTGTCIYTHTHAYAHTLRYIHTHPHATAYTRTLTKTHKYIQTPTHAHTLIHSNLPLHTPCSQTHI